MTYYEVVAQLVNWSHECLKRSSTAKEYLKSRGFTKADILEFKLGYVPPYPEGAPDKLNRFRYRIIFPWADSQGRFVGWTSRTLSQTEPRKYLNTYDCPWFKKNRLLYNFDKAKDEMRQSGWAVVVEGQLDVIRLWQSGMRNVVAGSGTAFSPVMARLLSRYCDRVVLVYDNDKAGNLAVQKTPLELDNVGVMTIPVILPAGEDPDSYVLKYGIDAFKGLIFGTSNQ